MINIGSRSENSHGDRRHRNSHRERTGGREDSSRAILFGMRSSTRSTGVVVDMIVRIIMNRRHAMANIDSTLALKVRDNVSEVTVVGGTKRVSTLRTSTNVTSVSQHSRAHAGVVEYVLLPVLSFLSSSCFVLFLEAG
jgi:hypothetical protein